MFPAYAGMIPADIEAIKQLVGVPRIRGDDPHPTRKDKGTHQVFPAYAGMIPLQ